MKVLILILFSLSFASVFASDRTVMARSATLMQANLTFTHLGDNLLLDVTSVDEYENKVEIQLAIGTIRRPAKIISCFISTFENNGIDYISNLEQRWDEPCK